MPTQEQTDPRIEALSNMLGVEGMQDIEQKEVMFPFSGKWIPTVDATLIGPENFQTLINMRYNDAGIEGVSGYTFRNATAITDYVSIKNGIHLYTEGRTQENYNLVHAVASTTQGRVYVNKTAIGSTGNFATGIGERAAGTKADYLVSDASVALEGRFSKAPGGNIAYANGEEVNVWGGDESTIASAFTTTTDAEVLPIDVTDKVTNTRVDSGNVITLDATRRYLTVMTRRPAQGFKFYVSSANVSASILTCEQWTGAAYAAVGNYADNTDTGPALAATGTITFNSTRTTAKAHHFQERYLYSYQFYLDDGEASISQITYDAPSQAPTNVWDGVYRTCIQAQVYTHATTSYEDYTLHVAESSTVNLPVGAILDALVATNDKLYIMFDEPMAGVKLTMLGNLVNLATSALITKYWNGAAFANLTEVDGTIYNGITLAQTGSVTWNIPSDEEKTTLFGTQGYAYEFTVGTTLTGTKAGDEEVVIDLITGIPAQQTVPAFKFPVQYKSKLLLCNYKEGNEGNRIDYSLDNNPDIFNGESTSMDGYQSIYVGGSEYLTCAAQIYNRFGSNLFSSLALFKNHEIYLLTGDSPIDYQLFPVSFKIGCPAPLSLATAEVGFELGENVARNVAMFVSNGGPMMYDGAVLYPMRGIEKYFDPNDDDAVNFTYLNTARGWFDSAYKEYNILLPTGTSTTLNTWFCYDVVRKKWYQKDNNDGDDIQCGWPVSASNGDQYIYGGTLIGKVAQLENGTSWGGSTIDNEIQVADFFPSGSEWEITRIRRLKFVCKRTTEASTEVGYSHYQDTLPSTGLTISFVDVAISYADSGTAGVGFTDAVATICDSGTAGVSWDSSYDGEFDISVSGGTRIARVTEVMNEVGWSHSFKFNFSSSTLSKGLQPIMWGVQYTVVRKDY